MMLAYIYKCQSQTLIMKHLNPHTLKNLCSRKPIIRSYATKRMIPTNVDSSEFKISFLKNKCGLSGKTLIRASKCLDSLVELFGSFGFPHPTIIQIISSYPHILHRYRLEKIIKPKLDFLLYISQAQAEVVAIVTKNPSILTRSLTNHLIPSINLLNSLTGSYANTLSVIKSNPYIINSDLSKSLPLNTQFLLMLGVPHSLILKLLRSFGPPILCTPHGKFRNYVLKLKDMGFNLESSYFFNAVTLCYVTDSAWESRCVLLRSYGFSDHEILSMFKKVSHIMCFTDKTINEKMEFFLNKLQWTPLRLSSKPFVLNYSLKKRTIPRCSVLQALVSKNSTSESYMLSSILVMTEKKFIEKFVTAHKDEVPGVMEAYQGKLRFDEYTFKQKGQLRLKPA